MTTPRPTSTLLHPRVIFIAGSLLVWLGWTLSTSTRATLGLFDLGMWFLDSHAVLAACDAVRAGLDPLVPNPYDIFKRPHVYSDWWLGLGQLGLTRDNNFLVGGSWVLGFVTALFLTVKPRTRGEALWLVLLAGSPPVMLGLMRANNDLVVFAVLAVGLFALRSGSAWRQGLAVVAVAVATGLKFYPIAAGLVFLLIQPMRRRWIVTAAALLVAGAVLWSVHDQVKRGAFLVDAEVYTMGARILMMDLGLPRAMAPVAAMGLLLLLAVVAVRRGWTSGLAREDTAPELRAMMTMGAVLLVFCFLATVNFGYRWIYALWLAPWLWPRRGESMAAKIVVWLLPIVLWYDALIAWGTVWWPTEIDPVIFERVCLVWRFVTQPLVWIVMILLTGWLLELVWVRWREVRDGFRGSRAP